MDIDEPDEKLTGEEKEDDFIGFTTAPNNFGKVTVECSEILQTAVVSN